MDHLWKYVSVLLVLNLALIICFYVTVSSDFTVRPQLQNISVRKRKQTSNDSQTGASTGHESTTYRNLRESIILNQLKQVPSMKTDTVHFPKYTVNPKTSRLYPHTKQLSKFKLLSLLRLEKEIETNETSYNSSKVKVANNKTMGFRVEEEAHYYQTPNFARKNNSACTFSFDSDSLKRAREKLSKPYYLFLVKLEIDGFENFTKDNHRDILLHWQYVLKQEKILVKLPVDFDLITFTMLRFDKEEKNLDVRLTYNNNSKCFQYDHSKALLSIRFLLWNYLFVNDTKYYLCNRYYEANCWRSFQYYFTTIWSGYDLTCSEISSKHGFYEFQVTKDLPGISMFCFLLSLQFVWIFALLDIKSRNISISPTLSVQTSNTDLPAQTSNADLLAQTSTFESTFPYLKRDRPYGPTRFFLKLLSCKCCCCCTDPTRRLIYLMWIFILLPFGICRTVLRPILNEMSIVGPSEPLFSCISTSNVIPIVILDFLYAIVCPCFYIYLGHTLHEKLTQDNLQICTCWPEEDDDHALIENNTRVSDRFTFRCYQCCKTLRVYSYKNNCKDRESCREACSNCCGSCNSCCSCFSFFLKNACRCIGGFIFCLFPIFSFNYYDACFIYCEQCWNSILCSSLKSVCNVIFLKCREFCRCICPPLRNLCEQIYIICCNTINLCKGSLCKIKECCKNNTICPEVNIRCNCDLHLRCKERCRKFFNKNCECCSVSCWYRCMSCCYTCMMVTCKIILQICLNCLCFIISYFLCLRPMISTFTFLFRAFTYFVFVALPIRAHIMRLMLIFVTVIFYFLRYFHEIINMNTEILNYIFKLEDEKTNTMAESTRNANREENLNVKRMDEEMFDYIYDNLMFVKKSYYILSLKMIVVIMYLTITIETYLTDTQSLTGANFKDMMEFLLIIIGPYAISVFLKASKDDFLTEENESEIKIAYNNYYHKSTDLFLFQTQRARGYLSVRNSESGNKDEKQPLLKGDDK